MAKWLEGANEAFFKAVPGGYVFQRPSPWPFAQPRCYLVNDAQKAALLGCLGRWKALNVAIVLIIGLITGGLFMVLSANPGYYRIAFVWTALIVPLLLVPYLYLSRRLAPLTATLPTTDQRITKMEQMNNSARNVAAPIIWLGAVAASIACVGNLLFLIDAPTSGQTGLRLVGYAITALFSGLIAVFFGGLLVKRYKLAKSAG
jgi:hypothetical protein